MNYKLQLWNDCKCGQRNYRELEDLKNYTSSILCVSCKEEIIIGYERI